MHEVFIENAKQVVCVAMHAFIKQAKPDGNTSLITACKDYLSNCSGGKQNINREC